MKSKWVLFDYADTLAETFPNKNFQVISFLTDLGLSRNLQLKDVAKAYWKTEENITLSSITDEGLNARRAFYLKFNEELFSNLDIVDTQLPSKFYAYMSKTKKTWHLKKDADFLLKKLYETGYKLGLLSNFDTSLNSILESQGIRHYFAAVQVSSEIGLEKPDIRFYEKFLKENSVHIPTCIFLGDNLRLDIAPMSKLGVNCILLDDFGVKESSHLTITKLSQLISHC